ncbi:hypothetical protein GCM10007916_33480 [Psychromonas marina]|uniref:N-acetyltransferase domain-containing protein n=1 Tax=Psychromonas marina TaxID=88364 RepID=A0ABQ6E501_9GAMM|nr:hypothetical protein [Psychromonas marina]GLS92278.1 hypothetical protein GCM10007916_33480 [Psychromonas marina]
MHKVIDIKLTSVFSPICQTLIHESLQNQLDESTHKLLDKSSDLLIIRQDNTVIGYALLELTGTDELSLNSLYFRSIVKDHSLGEYWLSRLVKRQLKNSRYNQFLLAS